MNPPNIYYFSEKMILMLQFSMSFILDTITCMSLFRYLIITF
jgi:hypothetical protein